MDKYRSRKFRLTIVVLLLASSFLLLGKLTGDQWVTVTIATLGLYKYANVKEGKHEN